MSRLVLLAVLGLAGSGAAALLPIDPSDPFRSTLVALPSLLAGFAILDRASGGRRLSSALRGWHLVIVVMLVGALWIRDELALRYSEVLVDRSLAAALAVLLGHRVTAQLVALRPTLGARLPRRPSAAFFFLALLTYLAILPWSHERRPPDGDEPYYLLLTHSVAFDLDLDLTNNYEAGDYSAFSARPLEPQPGDPVGPDGEIYSRHNALLPLALAPAYRAFGVLGALAAMACLTAWLAWSVLRLGRHYLRDRPGPALLAWGLFTFSAPMLLFSHQVWVEVPAALLLVVTLDGVLSNRRPTVSALAALALLPLLKLRFLLIVGPLALLAAARLGSRPRRALAAAAVGIGAFLAAIMAVNAVLFGNPLKYHALQQLAVYTRSPLDYLSGAGGLWLDCAFGLASAGALWLLPGPALLRPELRVPALWRHAAWIAGPYLLVLVPRGEWYGAWSPPFRYGVVVLPFLALAVAPCLAARRRGFAGVVVGALAWWTAAATVIWVAVPEWTYNLAHGRNHILDGLGAYFRLDVARAFPSFIEPRVATWIWLALVLAVSTLPWRRALRSRRQRPWPGLALALALLSAGLVGVWLAPSRIVEAEAAWVVHDGGALYPDRWVVGRRRYRGSWELPRGTGLEIPLRAGGESLWVLVETRNIRPAAPPARIVLEVAGQRVATAPLVATRQWQTVTLGPFAVSGSRPVLTLRVEATSRRQRGALVDRLRLRWE